MARRLRARKHKLRLVSKKKLNNGAYMRRRIADLRTLTTTVAVLDSLGGVRAVAALTLADWKNVETWKRSKTFPSRYYLVMTWALKNQRLEAPPSLWGMVTTAEMEKAAA